MKDQRNGEETKVS